MNHIVWKPYWDYEKEEIWLNEMAAKGFALVRYTWCKYEFEETKEMIYTYRLEMLENPINHPKSIKYIRFLEDTGVEFISSYMKWIYLRKPSKDGPFDIYTDMDSRINHYQKIHKYWITMTWIELGVGLLNLAAGIICIAVENEININIYLGIPLIFLGLFFLSLGRKIKNKINILKKEKTIKE